jgi:DNA adenine methylase
MKDPAPIRARHDRVTPLRYPGGKGKLTGFIREILAVNQLNGLYAEPYAGGAAIAFNLLLAGDVSRIAINDISESVFAFWHSVLHRTNELNKLIVDTPLTVDEWDRQKRIFARGNVGNDLELGFALFFLNRTNRSGIMNAGIIGGRSQAGAWKIDARYNAAELVARVEAIGQHRDKVDLTRLDAIEFLAQGKLSWPVNTLVYLDPPYYVKGRDLYYHFYNHADHEAVADAVVGLGDLNWIVSYDNVGQIRDIYSGYKRAIYNIGYSARSIRKGSEVMFFADDLIVPRMSGPVHVLEEPGIAAAF